MNTEQYTPQESYIRVASARPEVVVADVDANCVNITELYDQACNAGTSLVVFPELSLTGYTLGDLVHQQNLLQNAQKGLGELAQATADKQTAMVVGLPLRVGNGLYNCAAVLADGAIKGIVPKQNLPTYGEFYEKRWYQAWSKQETTTVQIADEQVPFGTDLLFNIRGVQTGVEICEDLWVTDPPSRLQAENGALLIANPSASPEIIGKDEYRRQLVAMQAARLLCGYVYSGCDSSESTSDVVMSGHQIISDNGRIVAEHAPFAKSDSRLITADIDIDHLRHERTRTTNYPNRLDMKIIECISGHAPFVPEPKLAADPFLPAHETTVQRNKRLAHIMDIAATGLAERIKHIGTRGTVLGLSGGLDSTLGLLLAHRAAQLLDRDPKDVVLTLTMPGFASSDRTQNNAQKLAQALGIPNEVVPIEAIATKELELLNHNGEQDVTYENVQARARTELLFNYANKNGGIVQGTGDLSETAIGFCTFNGDHMSHYNPNATIPKTLVRHLVRYASNQPEFAEARDILLDIVDTPISPELTKQQGSEIDQKSEDIIGPYQLHEFFLTYLVRWGDAPSKVQFMANETFKGIYTSDEITKWFGVFAERFVRSQFKRTAMPDGPNVGSVSLNPKANWRMPSDLSTMGIYQ